MKERLVLLRTQTVVDKVVLDINHPEGATEKDLISQMVRQASRDTSFWEPVSSDLKFTIRSPEFGE